MFDPISAISSVSGVSAAEASAGSLQIKGVERPASPEASRNASTGSEDVSAVSSVGTVSNFKPPSLAFLNKPEGPAIADLVQMQVGLMNYSMSLSVMTQAHKKISEAKSALMNEGKNG